MSAYICYLFIIFNRAAGHFNPSTFLRGKKQWAFFGIGFFYFLGALTTTIRETQNVLYHMFEQKVEGLMYVASV